MSGQPVTENVIMRLKDGIDIFDETSDAHRLWHESLAILSQQDGFQSAYYGSQIESPQDIQTMADWDSLEIHQKFVESPAYLSFVGKVDSIIAGPPDLVNFYPKPFPPTVLSSAPCIEIATFYQTSPHFLDNVAKFLEAVGSKSPQWSLGSAYGPVKEQIERHPGSGKGSAVILCIGWESKDQHMAFRDTDLFKENVHFLMDGEKDVEMHHVSFTTVRR